MNRVSEGTLPTFLVVGAMKAGTTSLYQYLRQHPDVFMSRPKEVDFFTAGSVKELDWYRSCFADARERAIGEASASYTRYPESEGVAARIANVVPGARIVYLVRHPIERMRSHYLHRLGAGKEFAPVDRALLRNPIYLNTSRYAMQIEAYLEHFPAEQILIVGSEDLRSDRLHTLSQVYRFIGVDGSQMPAVIHEEFYTTAEKRVPRPAVRSVQRLPGVRRLARHAPLSMRRLGRRLSEGAIQAERGEISKDLWARLEDLLRDDVRRLRAHVGGDFDGWGIC